MKRIIMSIAFLFAINAVAYADGSAFTPLNFNDTSYNQTNMNSSAVPATGYMNDEAIGNGNIQNAISQLENAQVDIRNDLTNCRTKFADVDSQYKLIKAERESLKKQIKSIERRLHDIDNAKERIRKNML